MCLKIPLFIFKKAMANGDKKFLSNHKSFGNFSIMKDLPYVDDGDQFHKLDILKPVLGSENGITLFYIHGGGYLYGTKEMSQIFCSWFVNKGFTVISINYRLMNDDDVDFKEQIKDVYAALKYVYDNRHNFDVDFSNLCLMGDSAGGHMALMLDLLLKYQDIQKYYGINDDLHIKIKCLALNSAMYDYASLVPFGLKYVTKRNLKKVLSKYCFDEEYLKKNSPREYILNGYNLSPTLNTTSYHDILNFQAFKFKNDAEKLSLNVKTFIETSPRKQIGHVYNHFLFTDEGEKCNQMMVDYLKVNCHIE